MQRIALLTALCIGLCLLAGCAPAQPSASPSAVRINEVQTSGINGDWIELYNPSSEPIDLGGCFLTNNPDEPGKWQFPVGFTVNAGEYRVLYADNAGENALLNFRLSAGGVTLRLSTHEGALLQELEVPAGAAGLSYGCDETGAYLWYASPTPAADNQTGMVLGKENTVPQYGLRINEYMTRNRSVLYDENGDYSDWVEIYNFSDSAIDLGGYTLTDARGEAQKWQFPAETSLAAGGYLVVRCSGRNTVTDGGEYHTNFKLGNADSFIGLYTPAGQFCSGVNYHPAEPDRSRVYTEEGYRLCRIPTPGYANSDRYLDELTEVTV